MPRECPWCGAPLPADTFGPCSSLCRTERDRARRKGLLPWDGAVNQRGATLFLAGFWEHLADELVAGAGEALGFLLSDRFDWWADRSPVDPRAARRALLGRWRVDLRPPGPRPARHRCSCGEQDPARFWRGHRHCTACERRWRDVMRDRRRAAREARLQETADAAYSL